MTLPTSYILYSADSGVGCNQSDDISKSSSLMRVWKERCNNLWPKSAKKYGVETSFEFDGYRRIFCNLEEFYFGR